MHVHPSLHGSYAKELLFHDYNFYWPKKEAVWVVILSQAIFSFQFDRFSQNSQSFKDLSSIIIIIIIIIII